MDILLFPLVLSLFVLLLSWFSEESEVHFGVHIHGIHWASVVGDGSMAGLVAGVYGWHFSYTPAVAELGRRPLIS